MKHCFTAFFVRFRAIGGKPKGPAADPKFRVAAIPFPRFPDGRIGQDKLLSQRGCQLDLAYRRFSRGLVKFPAHKKAVVFAKRFFRSVLVQVGAQAKNQLILFYATAQVGKTPVVLPFAQSPIVEKL